MNYTIRLTPPELRQRASNINNNASIAQAEIKGIEQIISQLRPTFLGETAGAFFKEFEASRAKMEQWDDIVRSFSVEIQHAANILEAADKSR